MSKLTAKQIAKTFTMIFLFVIIVLSIIGFAVAFGLGLEQDIKEKKGMDSLKIENLKLENELLRLQLNHKILNQPSK